MFVMVLPMITTFQRILGHDFNFQISLPSIYMLSISELVYITLRHILIWANYHTWLNYSIFVSHFGWKLSTTKESTQVFLLILIYVTCHVCHKYLTFYLKIMHYYKRPSCFSIQILSYMYQYQLI
jgi:hypothetical protein